MTLLMRVQLPNGLVAVIVTMDPIVSPKTMLYSLLKGFGRSDATVIVGNNPFGVSTSQFERNLFTKGRVGEQEGSDNAWTCGA